MICRIVSWLFALLYLAALAIYLIGTFGLFGAERDPLSGVFLVPLGWPWNWLIDLLPASFARAYPALAALSPLVNLAIIGFICRRLRVST